MTGKKSSFTISVSADRKKELEKAMKDGNWANLSSYCRHLIRAGESNIARLDPRIHATDASNSHGDSETGRITDEKLLTVLSNLQEECDENFVHVEDVLEPFLDDLEDRLTNRLFEIAMQDHSPVDTDTKGGYRVNRDE